MGMTMSICSANGTLAALVNNGDIEDADDYRVVCDECANLITIDYYDDHDGLCEDCYGAVHFDCTECGDEFHRDEQSDEFKGYCVECGRSKHAEEVESLNDEISDVIGSWDGDDDEIQKLRKLLSYAKRLKGGAR